MAPRAIVLSAGYGTRLRPLTDELPKPLVPIGDRPLLAHIAAALARAGFSEIAVNVHHLGDEFERRIRELPGNFHVLVEPEIRGTAGGIAGARALFGEPPVIAWNGDILADPPVPELLSRAGDGGLSFAVAPRPVNQGTVGTGSDGSIVRLRGERFGTEVLGGDYIGVAALGARALGALPTTGCLVGDYALPALRRGERVTTARVDAPFRDIGSPASYLAANREWLERHAGAGGAWVHPTARIAPGVSLVETVVGAGASVTGEGRLERCVVWPGATAVAPLRDAIVTPRHVVVAS